MTADQLRAYPAQHDFIACQDRFTAFIGGIGSGKTFAGGVKTLAYLSARKRIALVIAPTYPMLEDAALRTYADIIGNRWNMNRSKLHAILPNGSEILFRSADNPDRLRGPNIHIAHIDEAALCPAGTWEIVIGRLRADGEAGPCLITTTPRGRNWLYERSASMTVFRASTEHNPFLAPEFVQSLRDAYTGQYAAQELHGEFVSYEGLVYDDFNRAVHVMPREFRRNLCVIAVDEGYTNPAVALPILFDGDMRAHIPEEFYLRRVLQGDFITAVKRMGIHYQASAIVVDPSAAGLIADMQAAGLPATQADNRVFDGIQAVKHALAVAGDGRPRLTIAPGCANVISEMESYAWKQGRSGMKDEPEKVNDHAMDALRYGLLHVMGGMCQPTADEMSDVSNFLEGW